MDTSYDSIVINISADTSKAGRSIGTLKRNLSALQDFIKNDFDISAVELLEKHLQDIANIDFSNVSQGLKDVVSAFKSFQSKAFMKETANGTNLSGSLTTETSDPSAVMNNTIGINGILEQTTKDVSGTFGRFNEIIEENTKHLGEFNVQSVATDTSLEKIGEAMEKIGLNGAQMESVLASIGKQSNVFDPAQAEALEKEMKKIGYSAEQIKQTMASITTETDNSTGATHKWADAFKRILFYRVVRMIIQKIFQQITEGIQQLAKVDEKFNKSMSDIKNAFGYITRSIVSALAPIIEAIAPIIVALSKVIGQAFGMLGQALSGDTFAQAEESADDYAKSLKKVQNITLGIDELNTINAQDDGTYFSVQNNENATAFQEIMGKVGVLIQEISTMLLDVFKSVMPLISTIINVVMGAIDSILPIIKLIFKIVADLLEQILPPIVNVLSIIFDIVGGIIDALMPIITAIVNILSPIIGIIADTIESLFINASWLFDIIKAIVPVLKVITIPVGFLLQMVATIFEYLRAILRTAKQIFTFQWSSIGGTWKTAQDNVNQGWDNYYKTIDIAGYSTGGFAEDGLFFANHNELVGQFNNGKTAVANNEQIVEGIKQGVYEAMVMSQGQNNQETPQIAVYLDSREIAKSVEKRVNSRANNNIVGGYKYGN